MAFWSATDYDRWMISSVNFWGPDRHVFSSLNHEYILLQLAGLVVGIIYFPALLLIFSYLKVITIFSRNVCPDSFPPTECINHISHPKYHLLMKKSW